MEDDHEEHDNDCGDRCWCGAGGGDRDEDSGMTDEQEKRETWHPVFRLWPLWALLCVIAVVSTCVSEFGWLTGSVWRR